MTEWVLVRGAKVERTYLEESTAEARAFDWHMRPPPEESEHTHCVICNIAIPWEISPDEQVYQSPYGWLCCYCFEHFVKQH